MSIFRGVICCIHGMWKSKIYLFWFNCYNRYLYIYICWFIDLFILYLLIIYFQVSQNTLTHPLFLTGSIWSFCFCNLEPILFSVIAVVEPLSTAHVAANLDTRCGCYVQKSRWRVLNRNFLEPGSSEIRGNNKNRLTTVDIRLTWWSLKSKVQSLRRTVQENPILTVPRYHCDYVRAQGFLSVSVRQIPAKSRLKRATLLRQNF